MNKKIAVIFAFAVGAASGAIAAWKYAERIHNKVFEAELEANVELEVERRLRGKTEKPAETRKNQVTKPDLKTYAMQVNNYGYSADETTDDETDEDIDQDGSVEYVNMDSIDIISPEELGINEEYSIRDLTLYADGVITNEDDEVINYPEALLGTEALKHFGDYAENSVFVCNNKAMCYYEVTRIKQNFHPSED